MSKIEGYGQNTARDWIWPVVALVSVLVICGTLIFGGIVALKLISPNPSPVPGPVPLVTPVFDPAGTLSTNPALIAVEQQTALLLANNPIAGEVSDFCWGLAVGINDSPNTITTGAQLRTAIAKAGSIRWGTRKLLDPATVKAIDGMVFAELGEEPGLLTAERRTSVVLTLRAIAFGAANAQGA